jgi:hypothetical protein
VLTHQVDNLPIVSEKVTYSPVREVREISESVRVSPVSSKYVTVHEDEAEAESDSKDYVEVQPVKNVHTTYQQLTEIKHSN